MNIAPTDADVFDPEAYVGQTHVTPPEREALAELQAVGLRDVVRDRWPNERVFSYWDYRAGMFHQDLGMRIDLILASEPVAERVQAAWIDRQARKGKGPSDHAPVIVDLDRRPTATSARSCRRPRTRSPSAARRSCRRHSRIVVGRDGSESAPPEACSKGARAIRAHHQSRNGLPRYERGVRPLHQTGRALGQTRTAGASVPKRFARRRNEGGKRPEGLEPSLCQLGRLLLYRSSIGRRWVRAWGGRHAPPGLQIAAGEPGDHLRGGGVEPGDVEHAASRGSAMVNRFATIPTTTRRAAMPVAWR